MSFLTSFWVFLTTALDFLAIFLLFRNFYIRRELAKREELSKQKIYQITILREIQNRIGYSLDIEKIIDVITGSLKHLLPYSTASSMVVKEDRIILKTTLDENVNSAFIRQVKESMVNSMSALLEKTPTQIDERLYGVTIDESKLAPVASFFNIPLIVNNKVVGLINVSSTTPNLYKEDKTTLLYQITEQASVALSRLENLLETEKSKLTSMIGSLADGVFMVDMHKNLSIINDAAKNFLNLPPNANFYHIQVAFSPFDLASKIDKAIKENTTVEDKEVQIGTRFFQIFVTPVKRLKQDQSEAPIGASILLHDITVEKNISKIKEDFTNMMVHELRAPLSAIKDSAELMMEEDLGKEEKLKLLTIVDKQSKSMLEQIGIVLDAAKMEAGKFTIKKDKNDITKLIKEVTDAFTPQAMKKQITLKDEIPVAIPLFSFDSVHLTQVLNNLISNSLKFTNEGGTITVKTKIEGNMLRVSVSDNGIGIPKDEQKDLFSKYYQIQNNPLELSKKGSGLGLYITKGIVEAHGGTVGVESEEGKGTEIFFYLPLDEKEDLIRQNTLKPVATVN